MKNDDDENYAIKTLHENLHAGERVLMLGRCRVRGEATKNLLYFCLLMLVLVFGWFAAQQPIWFGLIGLIIFCGPFFLVASFYGRAFGFCALTDQRLIQVGDEGVLEIASRAEVRQIVGTDSKVTLLVSKKKQGATVKDDRLGRSKVTQRIELTPRRRFAEIVGGKELLLDVGKCD